MERKIYPSSQQKTLLVQLVVADPELKRGKCSSNFPKKELEKRWQAIAHQLNAVAGAKKTWEGWRKCWQDKKCKSKSKLARFRHQVMLTGKGRPPEPLTEEQQWLLNSMSTHSILGHISSNESMMEYIGSSQVQPCAALPTALPGTFRSRDLNENVNLKDLPPETEESPPNSKELDPNDEDHPDADYTEEEPIEIPKSSIPLYPDTTHPTLMVDPFVVSQTELRPEKTDEFIHREAVLRVEYAELRIKNEKKLSEIKLESEKLKQENEKLKHENLQLEKDRNKLLLEKARLELQQMKCRIQLPTRRTVLARVQPKI